MSLEKIIVALDYENPDLAFKLVETLGNKINFYKVGPVLFTRSGTEAVRFLHQLNKKIFVDLKLHDTPQVVANTIGQFAEMGVDFATLHCLGGKKMLEAANSACRQSRLKLLGVTLLTSFDPVEACDWGWKANPNEGVGSLIDLAIQSRLSGIICSPHEIGEAKKRLWQGGLVVTPGIRLKSKEVYQEDQVRVASPKEALEWGADYLVIGRPITQVSDPLGVVDNLFS